MTNPETVSVTVRVCMCRRQKEKTISRGISVIVVPVNTFGMRASTALLFHLYSIDDQCRIGGESLELSRFPQAICNWHYLYLTRGAYYTTGTRQLQHKKPFSSPLNVKKR